MPFIVPAGLLSAMLMLVNYFYSQNPVFLGISVAAAVMTVIILFINNIKRNNTGVRAYNEADELNRVLHKAGFADVVEYAKYRQEQIQTRELYESYKKQYFNAKGHIDNLLAKKDRFTEIWDSFIADCKADCDNDNKEEVLEKIKEGVMGYIKASEDKNKLLSEKENLNEKYEMVLREAGTMAGEVFHTIDDFNNYVNGLNDETDPDNNGTTLARLEDIIKETEDRKKNAEIRIAAINARLEQAPTESELSKVLEEISYYTEKKEELEMKGASLVLASQVLKEAALKMQRDYIPYLNEEMSRMMNI